jgi:hypothetical protein
MKHCDFHEGERASEPIILQPEAGALRQAGETLYTPREFLIDGRHLENGNRLPFCSWHEMEPISSEEPRDGPTIHPEISDDRKAVQWRQFHAIFHACRASEPGSSVDPNGAEPTPLESAPEAESQG